MATIVGVLLGDHYQLREATLYMRQACIHRGLLSPDSLPPRLGPLLNCFVESRTLLSFMDNTALEDFASYTNGARVVRALTSPSHSGSHSYSYSAAAEALIPKESRRQSSIAHPPQIALEPTLHPGACWSFSGTTGTLAVALAAKVVVTNVTIDHVPQQLVGSVRDAPRHAIVWGLVEAPFNDAQLSRPAAVGGPYIPTLLSNIRITGNPVWTPLITFEFDAEKASSIQTFSVPRDLLDRGIPVGLVVLDIRSNWGDASHTCLYRFRVHGTRQTHV